MELSDKDMLIMADAHSEIDEELVDVRKGVPQTRYIIEIKQDDEYFDKSSGDLKPVPSHLVGYWMQGYSRDNRYSSATECLIGGLGNWVKCKSVEVVVNTWEEIY